VVASGAKTFVAWLTTNPCATICWGNWLRKAGGGEILGVDRNLAAGWLKALAVVTTNYTSGRSEAWVDTLQPSIWSGSQVHARRASLSVEHVMASAALPFFFPSVNLQGQWHGDGGVRLAAPLSPAMRLGARRILAVSPRAKVETHTESAAAYPSPGQVAGVMLNAIFLDLLDYDALQMQRINELLRVIPESEWDGRRPVEVMVLRPQEDLGQVARQSQSQMPPAFRFFAGGFGGRDEPTADALSMVNFEPGLYWSVD
jgi:NTE family protein